MKNIIKKIFSLPPPSYFKKGVNDVALPSRRFTPDLKKNVYSWENYYNDLKKHFPIKYFFAHTVTDFIYYSLWLKIFNPLKRVKYWIQSHFISSRRYHMLDLRQPITKTNDDYKYGWIDSDRQILFAMFNILERFIKYEFDNFYCPSEEECLNEKTFKLQREAYFEILNLHRWWTIDRKKDLIEIDNLNKNWHQLKYNSDSKNKKTINQALNKVSKAEENFSKKEEEMLIRLIKIRKVLWT